jgi:hypothetical protein
LVTGIGKGVDFRVVVEKALLQRLKARGHADPERLWLLVLCFALSQSRATGNILT